MLIKNEFEYHIVDIRPWPLKDGRLIFFTIISIIIFFNSHSSFPLILGVVILLYFTFQWWRDIRREASFQGLHPLKIYDNIKIGIILFILSEIIFFFSFFWAFFHSRLSPDLELGLFWPPYGVVPFNPLQIPLLNTIILVISGSIITLSHFSLLKGRIINAKLRLGLTIILGVYFSILQGYEYIERVFNLRDSVFGAVFFVATGFHGLHVLVGTSIIVFILYRIIIKHFRDLHCFGFEARAWYWHFVDVVWLFLFRFIYWWAYYFFII